MKLWIRHSPRLHQKIWYSQRLTHCMIILLLSLHMTWLVYLNVCLVSFKCYLEMMHISYLQLKQHGQSSRISSVKTKRFGKVHQKEKVMHCAKWKAKLKLEWINNSKAKNGDFYRHGHAFSTANEINNVVVHELSNTTNVTFAIGTNTNTVPVCKWCTKPGHSHCSLRQCGKNKYVLAALAAEAAAKAAKEAEKWKQTYIGWNTMVSLFGEIVLHSIYILIWIYEIAFYFIFGSLYFFSFSWHNLYWR